MRTSKGDQSTVRQLNRRLILNHIRQAGQTSRASLAQITGLSPAAVTGVTAELISDQFLLERTIGESSGGRPPILLDIDYTAHYAIGMKLMETRLEAVLTDLSTRVLKHLSLPLEEHSPQGVADLIAQGSRQLLALAGVHKDRLIGLGLGLAGVVDASTGICRSSAYLGWLEVPIADLIRQRLGVSVWVDNDVNAFAAAERLFGHGKSARNFLVVTLGRGIGAGLVLGGELYRGRDGGAGELGHTLSEPDGRRCECGNHGCLEAYASEPALVARYNEQRPDQPVADIVAFLARRDELSQVLLLDAATRVGRALANLINVLNPEMIMIGGEGVRLGEVFFDQMKTVLLEHGFNRVTDTCIPEEEAFRRIQKHIYKEWKDAEENGERKQRPWLGSCARD